MKSALGIFLLTLILAATCFAEEGDDVAPSGPAQATSVWSGVGRGTLQPGKRGINLPANPKIMIIPVDDDKTTNSEMIDHWQAAFIERRLKRAADEKFDLVVLEINTNGGRIDACERINEAIASCPVPVIAFSGKAISGGAIISLGCKMIVMKPGPSSQIGDSMAVSLLGNLPSDARQKADSKMRAMVKTLCEANGYPCAVATGMVDRDVEIYELETAPLLPGKQGGVTTGSRFVTDLEYKELEARLGTKPKISQTWKTKGQILSLTAPEAVRTEIAAGQALDVNELMTGLGVQNSSLVETATITAGEKAARFLAHPLWRVLLVIVGVVALFLELKSPGHGMGYITFAFCLGVFFWLQIFANSAGLAEIIVFGIGTILLAVELFILPGFGIAGIAGFGMIMLSIILAFLPESISYSNLWNGNGGWQQQQMTQGVLWATLTLVCILAAVITALLKGISLPGVSRLALRAELTTPALAGAAQLAGDDETLSVANLVGQTGDAETVLRPSGKVRLNDVTYEGVSEGAYIEKGTRVIVLRVTGKRLLVRAVEA